MTTSRLQLALNVTDIVDGHYRWTRAGLTDRAEREREQGGGERKRRESREHGNAIGSAAREWYHRAAIATATRASRRRDRCCGITAQIPRESRCDLCRGCR